MKPPSKREAAVTTNVTGRVTHDDRGNAVWEWAISTGKFTQDASTQRLGKLDNPQLSLAEDVAMPVDSFSAIKQNPLGTAKGYSPYDSGLLAKKETRRKTDLRKLGEWMKLRKQAAGNNPDK